MKKWIIIGGGIQGCTMASYLRQELNIKANEMLIVDRKERPLQNWKQFTKELQMTYLRSPSIHHIDPRPFALEKFAKQHQQKGALQFYAPYDRPSLQLFNQHCDEVLSEIEIEKCWVSGKVIGLKKCSNKRGWNVQLQCGKELEAKNIVIAIGLSDQLNWPNWAKEGKKNGANIVHVFDDKHQLTVNKPIVIIGGGISAAHAALKWSKLMPGKVTMIVRRPLSVHQFDSDPGWLGPKFMTGFNKVNCFEKRRKMIKEARNSGSLPSELKTSIEKQKNRGNLNVIIDEVKDYQHDAHSLKLKSGQIVAAEGILLATGFEQKPPGMSWLQTVIQTYCLPCSSCGYPIPKPSLEWIDGLYLLGALAELQLGPVARNISGARRGAERILSSF